MGQAYAREGLHGREWNQLVKGFLAKDLIDALAVSRHRRSYQHGIGGGMQFEMLFGMGQRIVRDQRCDVRELGGFGLEELLARGSIEEEVAHGDGRSFGQAGFFDAGDFAAIDLDNGSGCSFFRRP